MPAGVSMMVIFVSKEQKEAWNKERLIPHKVIHFVQAFGFNMGG
jgi:hypothetical protein